jgi:adenylosuccinate lyase
MKRNLDQLRGLVYSGEVLLALTNKGISREDAYRLVQRNAMPVWEGKGDFRALLEADAEVSKLMSKAEIGKCFDPAPHLAHIDAIFKRVFSH